MILCLQCFDTVGWAAGRASGQMACNKLSGVVVAYLSAARCRLACGPADAAATHSLASVKSRLVLPFWYWLTRVVPDKGSLNRCVRVHVCVCVSWLEIVASVCVFVCFQHVLD